MTSFLRIGRSEALPAALPKGVIEHLAIFLARAEEIGIERAESTDIARPFVEGAVCLLRIPRFALSNVLRNAIRREVDPGQRKEAEEKDGTSGQGVFRVDSDEAPRTRYPTSGLWTRPPQGTPEPEHHLPGDGGSRCGDHGRTRARERGARGKYPTTPRNS